MAVNASVQPRTLRALEARSRSLKLSYELSLKLVVVAYTVVFSAAGVLDYIGFRSALLSPFWTAVPVARDAIMGSPLVRAERHAVSLIPDGVSVSASNIIGGHLSNRRQILLFPVIRDAEWIAVDTADMEGAAPFRPEVEQLRRRGTFVTVYESNGVVVMRRR